jgi:hypothetical protein
MQHSKPLHHWFHLLSIIVITRAFYVLRSDNYEIGCQKRTVFDVNLGNTVSQFVVNAYCQVTGKPPTKDELSSQVNQLVNVSYWRRIDLIHDNPQIMDNVNSTLDLMQGGIKVAMYDDTWGYPQVFNPTPSLSDVESTAQKFYAIKWRPWHLTIKRKYWYLVDGRPMIYFYNSGRLSPTSAGAAVVEKLKQLFAADFGVRPFVVQDRGFPPDMNTDLTFEWDPLGNVDKLSKTMKNGKSLLHVLPKFDAMGRSNPGQIARAVSDYSSSSPLKNYRVIKGAELLKSALQAAKGFNLMSIGTWNDLGEGTGVNRNFDYSIKGDFVSPFYFMDIIRSYQCL